MFKPLTAIGAAAFIAAAITILTAPSAQVSAGALPEAKSAPLRECAQRACPTTIASARLLASRTCGW